MDTTHVGNKIAEARKKRQLSQAQLGEQLFISQQAVGKWERGESLPDITTFIRLAKILGVDLNYFSDEFPSVCMQPTDDSKVMHPGIPHTDTEIVQRITRFNGSDLAHTDFAGITAHNGQFNGSSLSKSDFAGADLTGTSFVASDLREANFNRSNLTNCKLTASDLTATSFHGTILNGTRFNAAALEGSAFTEVAFKQVQMKSCDLRNTTFRNCSFESVDFHSADLKGLQFDGQRFTSVRFDKCALNGASFKGSILQDVSFRSPRSITNRYYKSLETIDFEGATMDKLTYAQLKGFGVSLKGVTVA